MPQRTLVVGDIHGAFKALIQVLERAGVSQNDKLIFLGDYVDGWSQSPEVIDYLIELNSKNECVFIRGNHDDLFRKWLDERKHNPQWLIHGGQATLDAYNLLEENIVNIHKGFLESLENYHLDDKNRLYVHAGFTNLHGVDYEYFPKMLYWDRSLWEMVLALDPELSKTSDRYPKRIQHYKEIYIGHTPTTRIGQTKPVKAANVWNLDTGAAYKSPLTIMDADTKEFWQSDNVNLLYPNEKGRN
ncbi:serine/threonine protein phosphatase 1 [Zhouia amylolytica]|uniref:Serine/threonine protein phosphatase 1 n=2 Tax=Zhouia amylolytica TaxID=376730 RepID=A0A1I6SFT5_9FLAO|nr:metallophosphoesterase family protein [Zhouia amylolytica]ETN94676.1 putative phosphoesterase [Zhouia amylolytica AD3]MCQ0111674.1 serine/threonine protein phosphatase [Zhouia amylolytica]SFS75779.1 serine/threonine protein phosphatase 1 [Zhouia amylolytica]